MIDKEIIIVRYDNLKVRDNTHACMPHTQLSIAEESECVCST